MTQQHLRATMPRLGRIPDIGHSVNAILTAPAKKIALQSKTLPEAVAPAERSDGVWRGGFSDQSCGDTVTTDDIELQLSAELVVRCELGLGGGL